MSYDMAAFAALVRRWTPTLPAPHPADSEPVMDGWVNPTPEEWASVVGRPPEKLPKFGEPFTQAQEDAELAALDGLAALTAEHDSWTAASLAFNPTERGTR